MVMAAFTATEAFQQELENLDIMNRLEAARFTPTKRFDPPHEYIMTHFDRATYTPLWHDMRRLIAEYGVVRPFFRSPQTWKYVDLSDGYTYWVMAEWITPHWEDTFKAHDSYVLNRKPQGVQ